MRAPSFWFTSPDRPGFWPRMLHPLAILWRVLSDRRQRLGAFERMPVPVICVGNINVGGTGKTPTVISLISTLREAGWSPHVISKGYGGSAEGPLQVDEVSHTADDVGDEPLLIAAFGPCWVAKNRADGARAAVKAGADVLILDDGMQNPDLIKDVTILVVDAAVGFGNCRLLPSGPLRQSVSDGMLAADMVLRIGPREAQRHFTQRWPDLTDKPQFRGRLEPLETGMLWSDLRAFAFAGIGRPEKFFTTLKSTGAHVVATRSFGDHQKIPLALLRRMEVEGAKMNAQLVTTEKDAVRLPQSYRQKVITLPVRLKVENAVSFAEVITRALSDFTPLDT